MRLEVDDNAGCEEVVQICKHLDLDCEILPAAAGGEAIRQMVVRRGDPDAHGEGHSEGGACDAAGPAHDEEAVLPALPLAQAQKRNGQPRAAIEAEHMLSVAPPGLSKFYTALVDAFPGHHTQLAKLMVAQLRAAGYSGPASSGSSSSSSSSSSGKRKKKKRKKKVKKEMKKERRRAAAAAKPEVDGVQTEAKVKADAPKSEHLEDGVPE